MEMAGGGAAFGHTHSSAESKLLSSHLHDTGGRRMVATFQIFKHELMERNQLIKEKI